MSPSDLRRAVQNMARETDPPREAALEVVRELLEALESGSVRAAEPRSDGWEVVPWVKQGILLGFRLGTDRARTYRRCSTFGTGTPSPRWIRTVAPETCGSCRGARPCGGAFSSVTAW